MSFTTWREDKKKKGNALKEMDAYLELKRNHGTLLLDTLTGDFGRSHGDYNVAHRQAEGVILFIDAMTRGDTELPALLKQAEAAKKAAPTESSSAEETTQDSLIPNPA